MQKIKIIENAGFFFLFLKCKQYKKVKVTKAFSTAKDTSNTFHQQTLFLRRQAFCSFMEQGVMERCDRLLLYKAQNLTQPITDLKNEKSEKILYDRLYKEQIKKSVIMYLSTA